MDQVAGVVFPVFGLIAFGCGAARLGILGE